MSMDDAAIVAAWAVSLVTILAAAPHLRFRVQGDPAEPPRHPADRAAPRVRLAARLERPAPQRLSLDPPDFEFDGLVIDMEPA